MSREECSSPASATSSSATTASASRSSSTSTHRRCRRGARGVDGRRLRDPWRAPRLRAARRLRRAGARRCDAARRSRRGRSLIIRARCRAGIDPASVDAHSMNPAVVLGLLGRHRVAACRGSWSSAASHRRLDEGIGLSEPVLAAVGRPSIRSAKSCRTFTPLHRRSSNRDPKLVYTVAARASSPRHRKVPARSRPLPQDP